MPLEEPEWINKTVREVRNHFGLVKEEIRAYFRKEELLVPGSRSSRRLDTCGRREDRDLVP